MSCAAPGIRFYVTFLSPGTRTPAMAILYATPGQEFRILGVTATEVFSIVDLDKDMGTPEAMVLLEKRIRVRADDPELEYGLENTGVKPVYRSWEMECVQGGI